MDDHLYIAGAYTDIATAVLMTVVVVTLLVRYRSCQYDRFFLFVLWMQPFSYYFLATSGVLTIIHGEKDNASANLVQSVTYPVSNMLDRSALLIVAFEMMIMRKRFTN